MTLPYEEPLIVARAGERVIPEPPRRGEPGGEPCGICGGPDDVARVVQSSTGRCTRPWAGACPARSGSPSSEHVDSFSDLSEDAAADFGRVVAKVERGILSLGDVARVHLYRWGDGGAHFHVWMLPRPLGDARGQRA